MEKYLISLLEKRKDQILCLSSQNIFPILKIGAPSVENLLFHCILVENLITNHGHILSSWLLLASSLLLACGKACIWGNFNSWMIWSWKLASLFDWEIGKKSTVTEEGVAEEAMLAGEVNYGALLGKDHDIGYGTREASLTLFYISFLSVNIFNFQVSN